MAVKKKRRPWLADEWVKEWTTNPEFERPSRATNDTNAERVRRFAKDFKGVALADITVDRARQWAADHPGRIGAVKAMLNDAKEHGVIPFNPFSGIVPDESKRTPPILTTDEVHHLAETAYSLFPDWPVMGTLILTAAYTGLGLGELGALQWSDVDWEHGTLTVTRQYQPRQRAFTTARYGKGRIVAMPEVVLSALRELPREGDDDLVFYSRRGSVYYSQLHTYFWMQVRAAFFASLPPLRKEQLGPALDFNDLRYFTARFLAANGVDPKDAAYQLGITVKRLYALLGDDPAEDSADRIRAAFQKNALRRAV